MVVWFYKLFYAVRITWEVKLIIFIYTDIDIEKANYKIKSHYSSFISYLLIWRMLFFSKKTMISGISSILLIAECVFNNVTVERSLQSTLSTKTIYYLIT